MNHDPILQGAMPSMHGRKSGIDDSEDILLLIILIPDILLAIRSMLRLSFLVPLILNLGTRFLLKGEGCNTTCYEVLKPFIKALINHSIRWLVLF
jgi:hypothetical protein